MEKIKKQKSIKQAFVWAVAITIIIVFALSALTIFGCYRIQKYLLPDSQEIWMHTQTVMPDGTASSIKQRFTLDEPSQLSIFTPEGSEGGSMLLGNTQFTIEKIESSFSSLSPRKQVCYRAMSVCMIVLPLIYSVVGIGICAWWFYRKKLSPPMEILADATRHIREQNLDFTVVFDSTDELGRLCTAFEEMRQALYDNNRQLWNMVEERRILQASVAHDLRNPIAIIEGYVEYMQECLAGGKLTEEKLEHTLSNLAIASKRLECYTDYIRDLHTMEETEVKYTVVQLPELLKDAVENFVLVARQKNCEVTYSSDIPECEVKLDVQIFYRVVENIFANALRYAIKKVTFHFTFADNVLIIIVTDDGKGFSKNLLGKQITLFYSEDTTGEHMGLGLAISRVLCQKHGGGIEISNAVPNGACVTIKLSIQQIT